MQEFLVGIMVGIGISGALIYIISLLVDGDEDN